MNLLEGVFSGLVDGCWGVTSPSPLLCKCVCVCVLRASSSQLSSLVSFSSPSSPALLPTSLEQHRPPLQAAVPALMPELKLALEQAEVCGVLQGLSQAWLPPAELLLPAGQLQVVALHQVGPTL